MVPRRHPPWTRRRPLWLSGLCLAFCGVVFVFLNAPMLIAVPLSFNAESHVTFTEGMLRLDADAWSLRWYRSIIEDEGWLRALTNSFLIGIAAIAMTLGVLAALGLMNPAMPARAPVMGLLLLPMVTPVIISVAGMFFFYADIGLGQTYLSLILSHAALGTPFVVIAMTAVLAGFDHNLTRAAASLGAGPLVVFCRIQLPALAPGMSVGALFAFSISFDEVVIVLLMGSSEQLTIPMQMWFGIREGLSPEILAITTLLVASTLLLLGTVGWLRRGSDGRSAGGQGV